MPRLGAVVAPAHVESHGHPCTPGILEGSVVGRNRLVESRGEVLASLQHALSDLRVSSLDHIAEGIELNVGHTVTVNPLSFATRRRRGVVAGKWQTH